MLQSSGLQHHVAMWNDVSISESNLFL